MGHLLYLKMVFNRRGEAMLRPLVVTWRAMSNGVHITDCLLQYKTPAEHNPSP